MIQLPLNQPCFIISPVRALTYQAGVEPSLPVPSPFAVNNCVFMSSQEKPYSRRERNFSKCLLRLRQ